MRPKIPTSDTLTLLSCTKSLKQSLHNVSFVCMYIGNLLCEKGKMKLDTFLMVKMFKNMQLYVYVDNKFPLTSHWWQLSTRMARVSEASEIEVKERYKRHFAVIIYAYTVNYFNDIERIEVGQQKTYWPLCWRRIVCDSVPAVLLTTHSYSPNTFLGSPPIVV